MRRVPVMSRAALALAAILVVGCGSLKVDQSKTVPAPPRAAEAVAAIAGLYHIPRAPVLYDGISKICADGHGRIDESGNCALYAPDPVIYFYGGAALNCNNGLGYPDQTGTCVGGDQMDGVIIVAAPDGLLFSQAATNPQSICYLAHEMEHEKSDQIGEGGCSDHNCPGFKPGGEAEQATTMLAARGM